MQTQLRNIGVREKRKTFNLAKRRQNIRLYLKNQKNYDITKVKFFLENFSCHFPNIKSRLYCRKYMIRKDVFFEQFLVLYLNYSHLLE